MAQLKATMNLLRTSASRLSLKLQTLAGQTADVRWQSSGAGDRSDSPDESSASTYKSRMVEFSASRARDFMGQAIDLQQAHAGSGGYADSPSADNSAPADQHVDSYDAHGSISLNAVMQTMVPEPYSTQGKKAPTHLNMPGGHNLQGQKYLSDDRLNAHYERNKTTDGGGGGGRGSGDGGGQVG